MNMQNENIELNILDKISHALVHQRNASSLLREVLDILQHEMGFEHGAFTLRRGNILVIEASTGLTEDEKKRGQYKMGEGVNGKVASTGKAVIISDISREPSFLGKTKAKRAAKTAYVCVPIKHGGEVIGTLGIDHPAASDRPGRGQSGDSPHPGGIRNRQGTCRTRHPLCESEEGRPVHRRELRGASGKPDRERTLRA